MTTFTDRRDFLRQAAVAGAGIGAAALGAWPSPAAAAGTVNWLAWGGHVEPQGLKAFFDSSGIRVNHISMSGNAETFAKLKLSGTAQYDLFEADDWRRGLGIRGRGFFFAVAHHVHQCPLRRWGGASRSG